MPASRYFVCPRCQWRTFALKPLFRHLRTTHGHEKQWLCGLSGCMRSFATFPSYRKHVHRKHQELLREDANRTESGHSSDGPTGAASASDLDTMDTDSEHQEGEAGPNIDQNNSASEDPVRQLALLLLKWKECGRIPESTIHEIANDIICYIQGLTDYWLTKTEEERTELMSSVSEQMQRLETRVGRNDYWKLYLPFVEPTTIILGTDERGKSIVFHYVPICEVLKNILDNPNVYSNFRRCDSEAGYLSSVFDGSAFRSHSYFQGDVKKICLQLYADELEICDPLGSKRGKHKLLGVYFSILNLPQRSTLSNIHLVLLVNDKQATAYGLEKVFAPLLNDVAHLENEGITVNGEVLKGSVFIMTGDNLSSHRIGGFKCSFSGGRICRFCLALRNEINYKHQEADFVMRTPQCHNHHLSMLKKGISTVSLYGVREPCVLNFSGFDATNNFPSDVMHDFLEGVVPFAMKHIIRQLVSSGFFSLDQLNQQIQSYKYEQCDLKNKPEKLSRDFLQGKAALKGSASQIWCFFRHFAVYVGDCVPCGHSAWELYLQLREIVNIVMCRKLPTSYVPYLHRIINFFCLDFRALFPEAAVPCKMHYLAHYPSFVYKYGPLVNIWAMRFESKHQYFKDMVRKLRNFKNVIQMLSVRHQYLQAYVLSQTLNDSLVSVIGSQPVLFEHVPDVVKGYITGKNIVSPAVSVLKSVRIDSIEYGPGMFLLHEVSDIDLPKFNEICAIFSIDKQIVFQMRELVTIEFDEHYYFYVITRDDRSFVLNNIWTLSTEPLFPTRKGDKCIINPRRALV
ncbi:uncharacterized protein LOC135381211 [Ornithodoros turicata]|uniref:uncharacterized protein LOC135381211 n=1 Tax=Ornithodoros turicata TaxID=34597 RepID=UPI003139616E